jgi:hypothetical protein
MSAIKEFLEEEKTSPRLDSGFTPSLLTKHRNAAPDASNLTLSRATLSPAALAATR